MKTLTGTLLLLALLTLWACHHRYNHVDDGLKSFTVEGLAAHIQKLASNEFEGRRPFTHGESTTINYLENTFEALGLEPGNGNSYLQEVPMVEIMAHASPTMDVKGSRNNITLHGLNDYVLWTQRTDTLVQWKNEEVVFAGFGIVAPEYNWNDYKDLDVKNKIVLVLVNDPGFGGDDSTFFKGNAMTYYGRWTYKFEEAARQGARGCLVIHNTVPAGYGFWVVQNNWNAPHLYLDPRGKRQPFCEGIGWTSVEGAQKIFGAAGLDFNTLQSAARKPGFKGMSLKTTISTSMKVRATYNKSYNVVARITGSERPEETIFYTAHWDHYGMGKANAAGDSIYNGAVDNAGGVAQLLEIAKAFTTLKEKPKRTVVFLCVTAEEQGLWGSAYYTQDPLFPLDKTVASINIDNTNVFGRTKDITVIGLGQSDLDDYLKEEAARQGRHLTPDPNPENGMYFRSDHINFARVGIPALYTDVGIDHVEKGKEFGRQQEDDYNKNRYHQPNDEYSDNWDLRGAIEDEQLLFQVGKRLAFGRKWPKWKKGSEFKDYRD